MAVKRVSQFLVPTDDDKNVHKQAQLRELALINGTLRDNTWAPQQTMPEERTWQPAKVQCQSCGETSHPTSDCPFRGTEVEERYKAEKKKLEQEYSSFLSEIGEEPPAKRANTNSEPSASDAAKQAAEAEYASFMADL